jgi:hypothetical protein
MKASIVFLKAIFVLLIITLFNVGCASNVVTIIPRNEGMPFKGNIDRGIGKAVINVTIPTGEVMEGQLTWFPPSGAVTASFINYGNKTGSVTSVSSTGIGMYRGVLVGNLGTKMQVELFCNTWTGRCFGRGVTSAGFEYDIQK